MHNRLEEADEALDEISNRPEDIAVLQAVGKSRDVLKRLEQVLKDGHGDLVPTDRVVSEALAD